MFPTIGRIVIYKVGKEDQSELHSIDVKELPAVIVRVWTETCVNLKILTDGPVDVWKTSVVQGTGEYSWSWPEQRA